MVGTKGVSYTYAIGTQYKTAPKPYVGGRSEDQANVAYQIDQKLKTQYSNTCIERGYHGDLHIECMANNLEYKEYRSPFWYWLSNPTRWQYSL